MGDEEGTRPDSLLPYDDWMEEALRQVPVSALRRVAATGLPGEHHFYLTFRTDHDGVAIPPRLRAQYPQEMTIVLQHQFWDLKVDDAGFSVGLTFGGVPSTLAIPFAALTAFADPHVRYALRFRVPEAPPEPARKPAGKGGLVAVPPPAPEPPTPESAEQPEPAEPQVVSLDAFRRRPAPKE